MTHLDDELLAGIALGEPDQPGASDRAHLLSCRTCASQLQELQALVTLGRAEKPGPVRPPGPAVLAAIQAELAADATSAPRAASPENRNWPSSAPGRRSSAMSSLNVSSGSIKAGPQVPQPPLNRR